MLNFSKLNVQKIEQTSKDKYFLTEQEKKVLTETFSLASFQYHLKINQINIQENDFSFLEKTTISEYSVVGIDGSQIYPSRHEGNKNQCLVNIGTAFFDFKKSEKSFFQGNSTPFLYNETNIDLTKMFLDNGIVDLIRQCKELEEALDFTKKNPTINLILLDGALTTFNWENKNLEKISKIFFNYVNLLSNLRKKETPIISYTSNPVTKTITNSLKNMFCTKPLFSKSSCSGNCQSQICRKLFFNDDSSLFFQLLQPQNVSHLFTKQLFDNMILEKELTLEFLYLKTENETVRLETVQNSTILKTSLPLILDQIKKGFGYPLSLSEAHIQANVSEQEKNLFLNLVSDKNSQVNNLSEKSLSKKRTFL